MSAGMIRALPGTDGVVYRFDAHGCANPGFFSGTLR